ncbi:hypothetical protein L6452_04532 [Arctium lappa]|uniref:Uncharacterized protein n=1 Tax=Arctium lappa TaxID=4217 RepID=A0ACB9EDG4_ARCLA|nr:hypothetical protein L6452_04532 [Arctium lappa]
MLKKASRVGDFVEDNITVLPPQVSVENPQFWGVLERESETFGLIFNGKKRPWISSSRRPFFTSYFKTLNSVVIHVLEISIKREGTIANFKVSLSLCLSLSSIFLSTLSLCFNLKLSLFCSLFFISFIQSGYSVFVLFVPSRVSAVQGF